MALVPTWMLGKHVTTVVAQIQTVASDGTLSDAGGASDVASLAVSSGVLGSGLTFSVALVDEVEFSSTKLTENISAIQRPRANMVPYSIRYQFTLTEIMRNGADRCRLAAIFYNGVSDIVKLTFSRARNTWTVYAVLTSYSESLQRGKNVARLSCSMIEANTAATYASGDR
jgi:hypothetical protein